MIATYINAHEIPEVCWDKPLMKLSGKWDMEESLNIVSVLLNNWDSWQQRS